MNGLLLLLTMDGGWWWWMVDGRWSVSSSASVVGGAERLPAKTRVRINLRKFPAKTRVRI